ncbi:hypothetical protein [Vibrio mediterranei]|uniref:hypothetical protein n=1 Tax=Vibrio mediterranei TaxID=689 RepID=UPI00406842A7
MSNKKVNRLKFRNLAELPSGSFQLKFKRNGRDIQPIAAQLTRALKVRNAIYLESNYRPNHLFVMFFDETVMADDIGIEKSGNPYHRFQVHARRLADRKYSPKSFNSKVNAAEFTKKWLVAYNAIAAVYNGWREELFLEWIALEEETLKPHICTRFDVILWNKAAQSVFGKNIPRYFDTDLDAT